MKIVALSDMWCPTIMDADTLIETLVWQDCFDRKGFAVAAHWADEVHAALDMSGFYHGYLEADCEALHVIMVDLSKIASAISNYISKRRMLDA